MSRSRNVGDAGWRLWNSKSCLGCEPTRLGWMMMSLWGREERIRTRRTRKKRGEERRGASGKGALSRGTRLHGERGAKMESHIFCVLMSVEYDPCCIWRTRDGATREDGADDAPGAVARECSSLVTMKCRLAMIFIIDIVCFAEFGDSAAKRQPVGMFNAK